VSLVSGNSHYPVPSLLLLAGNFADIDPSVVCLRPFMDKGVYSSLLAASMKLDYLFRRYQLSAYVFFSSADDGTVLDVLSEVSEYPPVQHAEKWLGYKKGNKIVAPFSAKEVEDAFSTGWGNKTASYLILSGAVKYVVLYGTRYSSRSGNWESVISVYSNPCDPVSRFIAPVADRLKLTVYGHPSFMNIVAEIADSPEELRKDKLEEVLKLVLEALP
jgi:hypothetical protein